MAKKTHLIYHLFVVCYILLVYLAKQMINCYWLHCTSLIRELHQFFNVVHYLMVTMLSKDNFMMNLALQE